MNNYGFRKPWKVHNWKCGGLVTQRNRGMNHKDRTSRTWTICINIVRLLVINEFLAMSVPGYASLGIQTYRISVRHLRQTDVKPQHILQLTSRPYVSAFTLHNAHYSILTLVLSNPRGFSFFALDFDYHLPISSYNFTPLLSKSCSNILH